ncbi:medium-chain fatty acid-CoA ligase faa2 [Mycoemilia scoparia]|uniref:Medium-chain fatty acid-CoA ligase faa2 n=1 Tax=Mycoemilia scoparia TaxID=417184 RepID=A0A9W7ZMW3_9FUNG|nr:medium-chain fatty acid-CoA ligase faa2 [Mycoemilia scoparia]
MSSGSRFYSRELSNYPQVEGETRPRVNIHVKEEKDLVSTPAGCQSLLDSFEKGLKTAGEQSPVLGYRPIIDKSGHAGPFKFLSFKELKTRFSNFGRGLVELGVESGDRCGLYSINRVEWRSIITVAIYDTLGHEAILHVISEAGLKAIVCTDDKAQSLIKLKQENPEKLYNLKHIVVMDTISDETKRLVGEYKEEYADEDQVNVLHLTDVEASGQKIASEEQEDSTQKHPTVDQVATICYTSGTTGLPKGVQLTHGNFLSACAALDYLIEHNEVQPITKSDVYLSYLPLAHVLEHFVVHLLIYRGARIGFYRGDTLKLMEDIQELSPTIFVGVPRIFNRIYDKVNATIKEKGGIAATLFGWAIDTKKSNLKHYGQTSHWLWDRIVFKNLREKLGGRVSLIVSGSAPISNDALDFLRCSFSANVLEGYGQTETTGCCILTGLDDTQAGTVGTPFPSCMVKLVDVPDLGYTVKDKPYPRGEVCVKGGGVFKGYFNQPEKTAETLDKDGWCHTGDIGLIDDKGRFKIIDRKKNLFKLAQGEYIAPERIENIYMDHPVVAQAFVYGDSLQSMLVGVVSPDEEALRDLVVDSGLYTAEEVSPHSSSSSPPPATPSADASGGEPTTPTSPTKSRKSFASRKSLSSPKSNNAPAGPRITHEELCADKRVREEVVKLLGQWGRSRDLKGFENIKNVLLEPKPFDSKLISPTFKLKRPEAKAFYKEKLDGLYEEFTSTSKK